ncbi:MAG: hypothetical protein JNM89_17100 [Hyphomicrobiaceae bacterium]|nr:hypothetical protein [Hyphomicrobiaceae bacterium]
MPAAAVQPSPLPGLDLPVSQLLGGVRRSLGLEPHQLAARLGTTTSVVHDIEAGVWSRLPPWVETARIASGWMGLAGMDPRAVLVALSAEWQALARAQQAYGQQVPSAPFRSSPEFVVPGANVGASLGRAAAVAKVLGAQVHDDPRAAAGHPHTHRRVDDYDYEYEGEYDDDAPSYRERLSAVISGSLARLRSAPFGRDGLRSLLARAVRARVLRLGIVVIALAVAGGVVGHASVRATAVSSLPAPAGWAFRSLKGFFAEQFAPVREGHRWVEVADPRSRRADKLPVRRQSY